MDQSKVVGLGSRLRRLLGAILIFATFLCTGCSRRSHPDDSRAADRPEVRSAQAFSSRFPPCPGPSASVLSDPHKIVLRWNPSTSSSSPNDPSVRYCVYRSDSAINVARRPDCPSCQTVTPTPVIGTSCMDNFGDGTKTYYYAVTAMNTAGKESNFSNKITARLNRQQRASSAANRQSPQPCRAPSGSTTPPDGPSGTTH